MAAQWRRFASCMVVFLTLHSAFSADPPTSSPSHAPEGGADAKISSPPTKPPTPSPDSGSPPAPPPSRNSSESPPSPAPKASPSDEASPSPAPTEDSRLADSVAAGEATVNKAGGMSGGKKAAIALGVVVGVGVVVVAGVIYKKRQNNIQRSQYGYATRTGMI